MYRDQIALYNYITPDSVIYPVQKLIFSHIRSFSQFSQVWPAILQGIMPYCRMQKEAADLCRFCHVTVEYRADACMEVKFTKYLNANGTIIKKKKLHWVSRMYMWRNTQNVQNPYALVEAS